MDFCRTRIDAPPGLVATHGILSSAALALSEDARVAAGRLLDQAREQAAALVEDELARCRSEIAARQQEALGQLQAMLAEQERLPREFVARTGPLVIELAQALFLRLAGELAPPERAPVLLRQLQGEAPPRLADPELRVHPDDAQALAPRLLPPGWRVRPDAALARGCYRLESSAGEWLVDFDAATLALADALQALGTVDGGALQEDDPAT